MRTRNVNKEQSVRDEAVKMLVAVGFDGFSMNKLAKNCGISVATLYIYYKDKDDMVRKIGSEIGRRFFEATLNNFDPEMSFEDGLYQQWKNRSKHAMENPLDTACFDFIQHSGHGEFVLQESIKEFKSVMNAFFARAIKEKEIQPMPLEVFLSVAYGPLYSLLRFHTEGKSLGHIPFKLTPKIMDQTFKLVIKALHN